jgi:hypothetical protein
LEPVCFSPLLYFLVYKAHPPPLLVSSQTQERTPGISQQAGTHFSSPHTQASSPGSLTLASPAPQGLEPAAAPGRGWGARKSSCPPSLHMHPPGKVCGWASSLSEEMAPRGSLCWLLTRATGATGHQFGAPQGQTQQAEREGSGRRPAPHPTPRGGGLPTSAVQSWTNHLIPLFCTPSSCKTVLRRLKVQNP